MPCKDKKKYRKYMRNYMRERRKEEKVLLDKAKEVFGWIPVKEKKRRKS